MSIVRLHHIYDGWIKDVKVYESQCHISLQFRNDVRIHLDRKTLAVFQRTTLQCCTRRTTVQSGL